MLNYNKLMKFYNFNSIINMYYKIEGVEYMKKIRNLICASLCFAALMPVNNVLAQDYSPSSYYMFPTAAPNSAYQNALAANQAYYSAPYGAPQITSTPYQLSNGNYSPETTNYEQVTNDAYLGTIYRTSGQRGDILDCVKNFKLTNIGINRTISETLDALTPQYDGSNSLCAWYKDPNNANSVICTCNGYKIYFDCCASSEGMEIYATVSTTSQGILALPQSEILNFFKNLDYKLTQIEIEKSKENNSDNSSNGPVYNNSVVINGNNSGTIIYNNK